MIIMFDAIPMNLIFLLVGSIVIVYCGMIERRLKLIWIKEIASFIFTILAFISSLILYRELSTAPFKILIKTISLISPISAIFEIDTLSLFMNFSILFLGLLVIIYSFNYMQHESRLVEYYSLLLMMMAGMVGITLAGDFFTFFIFWELMCISSYILVAFRRDRPAPIEAGFKYLVMSALGSSLILFGMSLLYGLAGNVNFAYMSIGIDWGNAGIWPYISFILLFLGFGIKAAIVPLHTWLPDAHPEAPSPISAMLSGIVIETGLYGLTRILFTVFIPNSSQEFFKLFIAIFSILTMTVGNLMALLQKDIKRLLAYSSIAQMGYMLIGVASGTSYGLLGCFLHVFNHSMMKGLAFLASGALVERTETRNIEEMRGLGRKMPITTLTLAISLLGLGGVPSMNGFVSKFILFSSVLAPNINLWWLAVAGVLNSAFSMAYYLPVIITLIAQGDSSYEGLKEAPTLMLIPMIIMSIIIIIFGVYPFPIIDFADSASKSLIENLQSYIRSIIQY